MSGPADETNSWGVHQKLASAVGSVAIGSAWLELALAMVYSTLLQSEMGDLIASGQPFGALCEGCKRMLETHPESALRTDLIDSVGTAKDLMERRNGIIHGIWTGPGQTRNVQFRRWGKRNEADWTQLEIWELSRDLHLLVEHFADLHERLKDWQDAQQEDDSAS